eukprot:1181189-Prorocentrum_minimum.AAC.4
MSGINAHLVLSAPLEGGGQGGLAPSARTPVPWESQKSREKQKEAVIYFCDAQIPYKRYGRVRENFAQEGVPVWEVEWKGYATKDNRWELITSTFQVASLTSPTSIDDEQRRTLPLTSERRRRYLIELQQLWSSPIDRRRRMQHWSLYARHRWPRRQGASASHRVETTLTLPPWEVHRQEGQSGFHT